MASWDWDALRGYGYSVARRRGLSHEQAEDIVQAAALSMVRSRAVIRDARATMAAAVEFAIADRYSDKRRGATEARNPARVNDRAPTDPVLSMSLLGKAVEAHAMEARDSDRRIDLDMALERLTPLQRRVAEGLYRQGKSVREMGKEMGVGYQSISKAWQRARERLLKDQTIQDYRP